MVMGLWKQIFSRWFCLSFFVLNMNVKGVAKRKYLPVSEKLSRTRRTLDMSPLSLHTEIPTLESFYIGQNNISVHVKFLWTILPTTT